MQRLPRTGASVYRQPPPFLPVVTSASAEPVPAAGLSTMVPAVLRPHVVTVYTAHMPLFTQTICNPAQVAQLRKVMADQMLLQQKGGGQSI